MNKMQLQLKFLLIALSLVLAQSAIAQPAEKKLTGRWQVKFVFAGRSEMNLVLDAHDNDSATFLLLDTAPDSKPEAAPRSATWTATTNDRVSFSGEVELPFGTCCRETGTLIFKGKFTSNDALSGKVIFIGNTEEEENPIGFRAMIGTFTAKRLRG